MKVEEIMTTDCQMISPSDSVCDAAKMMKSLDVGFLPVREGNTITGILSDRDIVIRAIAENADCSDMKVSQIMSKNVASCFADQSIQDAAHIMEEKKIRRLIVMDHENNPIGIVSLGDIAAKSHAENLSGEVLELISQPCCPKH